MDIDELLDRYQSGQRDFSKVNLSKTNLTGLELKEINLSGANLSFAQMRGIDLKRDLDSWLTWRSQGVVYR